MQPISAVAALAAIAVCSQAVGEPFDYHSVRGRLAKGQRTGMHEGEALSATGVARVQGMGHYGPHWSGNAHLLWHGKIGESTETRFEVSQAGRHKLKIQMTLAPDYGRFALHLDGAELTPAADFYSPRVELAPPLEFGDLKLDAGEHVLVFKLTGANERAQKFQGDRHLMGLDYLLLTPLDPPKERAKPAPKKSTAAVHEPYGFEEARPVMAEFCFRCHGSKKVKGKVDLEKFASGGAFRNDIELTRKMADVLEFHEMPPEDEKQPGAAERGRLLATVHGWIDAYLKTHNTLPAVTMRRLNRYEYNNAVHDLLKLKGDIYPLPEKPTRAGRPYFNPKTGRFPDVVQVGNRALGKNQIEQTYLTGVTPFAIDLQAEHGFNNRGEELGVSAILLESFLKLAQSIVNAPEFDGYSSLTGTFFSAPPGASAEERLEIGKERLRPFLAKAFRGPPSAETTQRYLAFFESELLRSGSFSQGIKRTVAAILASPKFLYITERGGGVAGAQPLSAFELATRLSFFLWSSIPDDALLEAARSGALLTREGLATQIDRLLEDPRCQALSQNFARQWLRLDQLINAVPDFDRYQFYYSRIGCEQWKFGLQTMIEPLLLFESIVVEDRSILLLVDSDHSWRSDELQSWYRDEKPFRGRGNVNRFNTNQQAYKRRKLDTRREGGVMTTAAVLTMTSSPLRTNPITRGAWMLTVMFNQPPPPPPDDVPEIEADEAAIVAQGLTLRQRLKQHVLNENCASCHSKIDPLGFAFENYDAVGRWRDSYASGLKIDASGVLFGESKFEDVVGLKDAMLEHPERFVRAFSEHMLSYALGRELEIADKPAVDRIVRAAMADRGKFSTVVHEIVKSYPFRYKGN